MAVLVLIRYQKPDSEVAMPEAGKKLWYASCEAGHAYWSGSDKDSYQEAKADADEHDKNQHGGTRTAVVLSHS